VSSMPYKASISELEFLARYGQEYLHGVGESNQGSNPSAGCCSAPPSLRFLAVSRKRGHVRLQPFLESTLNGIYRRSSAHLDKSKVDLLAGSVPHLGHKCCGLPV
jgi:hypothetical protein